MVVSGGLGAAVEGHTGKLLIENGGKNWRSEEKVLAAAKRKPPPTKRPGTAGPAGKRLRPIRKIPNSEPPLSFSH